MKRVNEYLLMMLLLAVALFLAGCASYRVCYQGREVELHEDGEYVTPLVDARACQNVKVIR